MSYEAVADAPIAALRSIALVEVTARLAATLGASFPAVRETRGYPAPLSVVEQSALPLMCVYVAREESASETRRRHADREATIVFEYFAPITPLSKIGTRWPLLRGVFSALLDAIHEGEVTGVPVLDAAGVVESRLYGASVAYDFASDGEVAIPHFRAEIPFILRTETPVTYDDLTRLVAGIDLYAFGENVHDDLVRVNFSVLGIVPEQGGRFVTESFDVLVQE